jgi:hypothetical protein
VSELPRQWTIDTFVLYEAVKPEGDCFFAAQVVLMRFVSGNAELVLDQQGKILEQYDRCIARTERDRGALAVWLRQWLQRVKNRGSIHYYDGNLAERHRRKLRAAPLSFDPSDLVFVAVAHRSADKLIVSEDSDYTDAVKEYLRQRMDGIRVLSILEAEQEE